MEELNNLRGTQDSGGTPPGALPPVVILISTLPSTSVLRVLLFVDPELVSPSVCSALLLEIEAAQIQQTPEACMRLVVSHTLQAALGETCHAEALQRKLKVMALPQPSGSCPGPCVPTPGACSAHLPSSPVATLPFFINPKLIHNTKGNLKNADHLQKVKITYTPLLRHISN